jgi:cell division protein FtsW
MVWLLGQATVNMAVVTGLAPVVGIPLPFISYGGSALLSTAVTMGFLLALSRRYADARVTIGPRQSLAASG